MQTLELRNTRLISNKTDPTVALSETLERSFIQLERAIKTGQEGDPGDQVFQDLKDGFLACLNETPIDFAYAQFKKMACLCEKNSLLALYPIFSVRGLCPINPLTIEITTRLANILIEGGSLMLNQLVVDERFISLENFEKKMLRQLLTIRESILSDIITFNNLAIQNRLLMVHLLMYPSVEQKKSFSDEAQLPLHHAPTDSTKTVEQVATLQNRSLQQTPVPGLSAELLDIERQMQVVILLLEHNNAAIPVRYAIDKILASVLYLKAIEARVQGRSEEADRYEQKIVGFYQAYDHHIKQDCLMSDSFGLDEIRALIEQLPVQSIESTHKKKKSKKKSKKSGSELFVDQEQPSQTTDKQKNISNDTSGMTENQWHERCDQLEQTIQSTPGERTAILTEISQDVKQLISLFYVSPSNAPQLYEQAIGKAYLELINASPLFKTAFEQFDCIILDLYTLLIELGIHMINAIHDKMNDELIIKKEPLKQLAVYFSSTPLLSSKSDSIREQYVKINQMFVTLVVSGCYYQSRAYLSFAENLLDSNAFSPNDSGQVETINRHIGDALRFHAQIDAYILNQPNEQDLRFLLETILDKRSSIKSRLFRAQGDYAAADLLDKESAVFTQQYAYKIEGKTIGNPHTSILQTADCLIDALEEPDIYKQVCFNLHPSLEAKIKTSGNLQLEFADQLSTHLNQNNFKSWFENRIKKLEDAWKLCFEIDNLNFTYKQYELMAIFVRQFSFLSLYQMNTDQTISLINEQSVMVLSRLMEALLNTGYDFVKKIDAHKQVMALFHGASNIDSFLYTAVQAKILQRMALCVLYIARVHLLLGQALLENPMEDQHPTLSNQVKIHLEKSNPYSAVNS